jgi:hypothetical protein
MADFDVAHLQQQGQEMIIVPLDRRPNQANLKALQVCAARAGLGGVVIPVWDQGGRLGFIAPMPWHPFFCDLTWDFVLANINGTLTCG